MPNTVFYSWQADTPARVGRSFLKDVLELNCMHARSPKRKSRGGSYCVELRGGLLGAILGFLGAIGAALLRNDCGARDEPHMARSGS